jgi:hypothetical protein
MIIVRALWHVENGVGFKCEDVGEVACGEDAGWWEAAEGAGVFAGFGF